MHFLKKFQKHFQDRVVVTNLLTKPLWLTRKDNKIHIMEGRNEMLSKIFISSAKKCNLKKPHCLLQGLKSMYFSFFKLDWSSLLF